MKLLKFFRKKKGEWLWHPYEDELPREPGESFEDYLKRYYIKEYKKFTPVYPKLFMEGK